MHGVGPADIAWLLLFIIRARHRKGITSAFCGPFSVHMYEIRWRWGSAFCLINTQYESLSKLSRAAQHRDKNLLTLVTSTLVLLSIAILEYCTS